MKKMIKEILMWAYAHGLLSQERTQRIYNRLGLHLGLAA
jgi:hypothetical protein